MRSKQEQIDSLNEVGWNLRYSDFQQGMALCVKAEHLARGDGEPYTKGLAVSLCNLAWFSHRLSRYDDALSHGLEALSLFRQIGHREGEAFTLNILGATHLNLGNHPDALACHLQALTISKEIGDRRLEADSGSHIGIVYRSRGEPEQALEYLLESLSIYRELDDRKGEADTLDSAGVCYRAMGAYSSALTCSRDSVQIYHELGNQRGEAEGCASIGEVYLELNDYTQALAFFERCLQLSRETSDQFGVTAALINTGRVRIEQVETEKALEVLDEALDLAGTIKSKGQLFEIHSLLAEAHKQAGDFETALAHYEQFHTIKEAVFSQESDTKLKSLQVLHDVETARTEAELQQLRNRALREEISEREQLIADLDAYAHTVAHDLKSPLGLITAYADLLMGDIGDELEPNAQDWLATIYTTSEGMIRTVDELLILAGVRRHDIEVEPVDMAPIVRDVRNRLAHMIDESNAEIITPENWPQALGYAPWVAEIWMNCISNAIKYGGEPPRVELGATPQDDGFIRFWVRDNGAGINPEAQEQLFTPFTRLQNGRSAEGHGLGLSIVYRIAEKLGGGVDVESEGISGKGSTFSFTLPGVE